MALYIWEWHSETLLNSKIQNTESSTTIKSLKFSCAKTIMQRKSRKPPFIHFDAELSHGLTFFLSTTKYLWPAVVEKCK